MTSVRLHVLLRSSSFKIVREKSSANPRNVLDYHEKYRRKNKIISEIFIMKISLELCVLDKIPPDQTSNGLI